MKKYEIDMSNGSILPKIFAFTLPLMLTGILHLLFNAADIVVVGKFAGDESLAAVGSTTSIVNLFVNIAMGLSVGVNIIVSIAYGAKNYEKIHRTVQTAVLTSLILGVIVGGLGYIFAKPILFLMDTPNDIIDKAADYLKIYFLGMPALLIYNYIAAILRAFGDTRRPLIFLFTAGIINVILNLIFTIVFRMDVKGVAIATVISQTFSMVLILRCLIKTNDCYRYNIKEVKIYPKELFEMVKFGFPAAATSSLFSFSNMIIQSSVNTFGSVVIAGNSIASSIEGFVYTSMDSVSQATLTFTGQNYGAKKYKRLNPILFNGIILVTLFGLSLGLMSLVLDDFLFGIYTNSSAVIAAAKVRAWVIMPTYFMCGIMNVFIGSIRGHGYSILPTVISAVGILAVRLIWVYTIFSAFRDIRILYSSWGVSYLVVIIAFTISYIIIHNKIMKKDALEQSLLRVSV